MRNRSMGTAVLCMALATSPLALAAGKKEQAKKAAEPAPVVADVAPPSGSWEATPAPNKDYVWSKGYYEWKDGRYQWTPGEWVLKKEDMAYLQREWVKRPDGKYELTGGKWVPADQAAKAKAADGDKSTADAKGSSGKGSDAKASGDTKAMGAASSANAKR